MDPCIVVVDDDEDIRQTLKDVLETGIEGTRVRTAQNGTEGLGVLREEGDVRLIISDFRMPGMDGIQFLQEAGLVSPGVPRLLLTAYDLDPKDVPQAKLVHKPFGAEHFLGVVADAIAA